MKLNQQKMSLKKLLWLLGIGGVVCYNELVSERNTDHIDTENTHTVKHHMKGELPIIYADNAATTQPSRKVIEKMMEVCEQSWGNPSSQHTIGFRAKKAIETAREQVALAINANPNEIYFTSGGSESNNWAIKSALPDIQTKRILTSRFEHHSLLHACKALESNHEIKFVNPRHDGLVHPEDLQPEIINGADVVSIMTVNNELGTIQPVDEIARLCHAHNALFHTDAVQAIGNIPIDVQRTEIDMLSLSGHKFHAPQGIGVLYVREGVPIANLIHGGQQESYLRAGTENVAAIAGLGVGIQEAVHNMDAKEKHLRSVTDCLIRSLKQIPFVHVNEFANRIAGTVSVSFEGVEANTLIVLLNRCNIYASAGSACDSQNYNVSHVLEAVGLSREMAIGTVRFSFDSGFTKEQASDLLDHLSHCLNLLHGIL